MYAPKQVATGGETYQEVSVASTADGIRGAVELQPVMQIEQGNEEEEAIDPTQWRDKPWAVVWYLALAVVLGFGIYGMVLVMYEDISIYVSNELARSITGNPWYLWVAVLMTPIAMAVAFYAALRYWTKATVYISIFLVPTLLIVRGLIDTNTTIPNLIIAFLSLLWIGWHWKRIPFNIAVAQCAMRGFEKFKAPMLVHLAAALINAVITVFWIFGIVAVVFAVAQNFQSATGTAISFVAIFLLLWITICVSNVAFSVSCGVMSSYYFIGSNSREQRDGVTCRSIKRALTTSFGSICFASAVESAVETLRGESNKQGGGAGCLVALFGDVIKYINSYALVQVATFGKPYCRAAKDSMNLILSRDAKALTTDFVLNQVFTLYSILTGFVTVLVLTFVIPGSNLTSLLIILAVFVFSAMVNNSLVSVVTAYSRTLIVCYLEDPQQLAASDPKSYARITEASEQCGHRINWKPVVQHEQQNVV